MALKTNVMWIQPSHHPDAVQWTAASGGNNHWYLVDNSGLITWQKGILKAESHGGHAATLRQSLNSTLCTAIDFDNGWGAQMHCFGPVLGGIKDGSGWEWITGEEWLYSNDVGMFPWALNEPRVLDRISRSKVMISPTAPQRMG